MRALLLAGCLCLAGPAQAQTAFTVYRGGCDGSAAAALDAEHFVVGNDDENTLRVYRRGESDPRASLDLNPRLDTETSNKTGMPKEADIEGAARIGNRIYWIASHGRDSGGHKEPSRHRFFATDIATAGAALPDLKFAGRYRGDLVDDLLEQVSGLHLKEAAGLAPEQPGGLNIEGLAATPDGQLLIGFRNPRPAGRALVIPLKNPAELVDEGRKLKPLFGVPDRVFLGTRGIRSIDRVGDRYVIVAGPYNDGGAGLGGDFALYTGSGPGGAAPKQDTSVAFGDFRPEALFALASPQEVYVLSDDGTDACKKLPQAQKTFRGRAIRLSE